jgi:hypothetical protein
LSTGRGSLEKCIYTKTGKSSTVKVVGHISAPEALPNSDQVLASGARRGLLIINEIFRKKMKIVSTVLILCSLVLLWGRHALGSEGHDRNVFESAFRINGANVVFSLDPAIYQKGITPKPR